MIELLAEAILCIIIFIATVMDIRSYKVKNIVFVIGWIVSLLVEFIHYGGIGILRWSAGCVLPIIILLPLFLIKGIGGADVKAFSVIGAFMGIDKVITITIISFIIAAIFSLAKMIICRNLFIRLRCLANYISDIITTGKITRYYYDDKNDKGAIIHFMVPIFIALVAVLLYV